MREIRISLSLICTTPPSVGAGGAHGTIADKVVIRNAAGQYVIPASQVKGKLRHACEQLLRAQGMLLCHPPRPDEMCPYDRDVPDPPCLLCQIFGSPERRCTLRFHDLTTKQSAPHYQESRQMVSLNRRRRTAEAQRLFQVETAPNIRGLKFENDHAVTGFVYQDLHVQVLLAGLKMIFAWGGGASRGLGWAEIKATAWSNDLEIYFNVEEVKRLCQSCK